MRFCMVYQKNLMSIYCINLFKSLFMTKCCWQNFAKPLTKAFRKTSSILFPLQVSCTGNTQSQNLSDRGRWCGTWCRVCCTSCGSWRGTETGTAPLKPAHPSDGSDLATNRVCIKAEADFWSFVKRKTLLGHRPVSEKTDFVNRVYTCKARFTMFYNCKAQFTLVKCDSHL